MPFKSKKQRRWMYVNEPEMAKRWEKHTPKNKKLPESAPKKSMLEINMKRNVRLATLHKIIFSSKKNFIVTAVEDVEDVINLNKPMKYVTTQGINSKLGPLEMPIYIKALRTAFSKKPVDMYIFETKENETDPDRSTMTMREAGYVFGKDELGEQRETVWKINDSLPTPTFWAKIDDYGDYFLVTFLLPEEW